MRSGEDDGLDMPVERAHRYHVVGLVLSGFAAGLPGLFDLVTDDARRGATKAAIALLVVAVLGLRARYLTRGLGGVEPRPPAPAVELALLVAAVAIALAGAAGEDLVLWAMLPGSVLSAVFLLDGLPHSRFVWIASAVTISLFSLGALLLSDDPQPTVVGDLAFGAAVAAAIVVLELSQLWYSSLVGRLNDSRRLAADLAVAQERLRFAADLHDIQGHHLQVIAVKGDLVSRLAGVDAQRARDEAAEIAGIARRALAETREVVHGYREASLGLEVTNALKILEAAGVATHLRGEPQRIPHGLQPLFGRLVREGATNVLRHSRATCCRIEVGVTGGTATLRLHNDGVLPDREAPGTGGSGRGGSGLAGLRERFAAQGARLEARRGDNWFELVGSAPTREG